ncbi:AbrB family looped-hinge helix DNA binding protein [Halohasta litchfieldiae]|jgi:AbrB family looped-hinge helix DNA binding protein|uniref:Looped-hinge helix DNA binding domain-containing protein, AbrB family n=1 Tax=Halohasta litchfieldiae TaxID=1073996 RepID=A0A1H6X787_9EURY|nr:AbrB/MazE/SpoVT family DNA-binding domain-containing protein [Halohasta litchfieldiae]ATW88105.1 AbrB family looped-hinge helix DNA binding protein [Halohasta litchfieldiae]SEJ23344.1 looped-hinge helix DNA binding domain-containing protein, AbrB family [Halohasta litchfieldiae]
MSSNTREPDVVRVSQKGQATIPKPLREKFGIDTPGEVFIYEEGERIVVEPVPSLEELGGIHASDDRDRGEMIETVRERKREEMERDKERIDRLRSSGSGDE